MVNDINFDGFWDYGAIKWENECQGFDSVLRL